MRMNLQPYLLQNQHLRSAYDQGQDFLGRREGDLFSMRKMVSEQMDVALREFRISMSSPQLDLVETQTLLTEACDYVKWLGWGIDDICCASVAFNIKPEVVARRIIACHFVYQSGRIIDDVIDDHVNYKKLHPTLMGVRINRGNGDQSTAKHECILVAVSLLLRGVGGYAAGFGTEAPTSAIRRLTSFASAACLGALAELEVGTDVNSDAYAALVDMKSAAHNQILLQPLEGLITQGSHTALRNFSRKASFLGQVLNDAGDIEEDQTIGQANYFNRSDHDVKNGGLTTDEATIIRDLLGELSVLADTFPMDLREACCAKITTFIHKALEYELV